MAIAGTSAPRCRRTARTHRPILHSHLQRAFLAQKLVTPSTAGLQTGVRPGGQETEQPGHFGVPPMLHAAGADGAGATGYDGGGMTAGAEPRPVMTPDAESFVCVALAAAILR